MAREVRGKKKKSQGESVFQEESAVPNVAKRKVSKNGKVFTRFRNKISAMNGLGDMAVAALYPFFKR